MDSTGATGAPAKPVRSPFQAHLGITAETGEDGNERLRLPFRREFCHSRGGIHGGLLATLLDMAMSRAVGGECSGIKGHATVSLNINYFAPGETDLLASAKLTRKGSLIVFVTADVQDTAGTVVASGNAVFRLLR